VDLRYLDIALPNIQSIFEVSFCANKNLGRENDVLVQDTKDLRVQITFINIFTFTSLHLQLMDFKKNLIGLWKLSQKKKVYGNYGNPTKFCDKHKH